MRGGQWTRLGSANPERAWTPAADIGIIATAAVAAAAAVAKAGFTLAAHMHAFHQFFATAIQPVGAAQACRVHAALFLSLIHI